MWVTMYEFAREVETRDGDRGGGGGKKVKRREREEGRGEGKWTGRWERGGMMEILSRSSERSDGMEVREGMRTGWKRGGETEGGGGGGGGAMSRARVRQLRVGGRRNKRLT